MTIFEKLKSDVVEDLYFEGGRDRRAFRKLLASGGASAELLARVVDTSASSVEASAAAVRVWKAILRGAFVDVDAFEFSATDAAAMAALLSPLAAMTAHPPLLRVLALLLLREVMVANAPPRPGAPVDHRAWARKSVMASLLEVTTYLDPIPVRHSIGGKLSGGLPAMLAEVTGYPRNRCGCFAHPHAAA